MTNLGRGGENEVSDPDEKFSPDTDTHINITTSHIQTPIHIGISGPTWVTAEEAEITHCYLHLDVERGCKCEGENFVVGIGLLLQGKQTKNVEFLRRIVDTSQGGNKEEQ